MELLKVYEISGVTENSKGDSGLFTNSRINFSDTPENRGDYQDTSMEQNHERMIKDKLPDCPIRSKNGTMEEWARSVSVWDKYNPQHDTFTKVNALKKARSEERGLVQTK